MPIKPKPNKVIANGAKENAFHDLSNRILNPILNHVNHIASNPMNGTVDTAKTKPAIEQNGTKTNGHSEHDNRTIIEKLKENCKSIR